VTGAGSYVREIRIVVNLNKEVYFLVKKK